MPSAVVDDGIVVPPAADTATLPDGSSPLLTLVPATAKETRQASVLNGQMWSGPLALPDYLRREEHLCRQALAREGGLTAFILVDSTKPADQRDILAACETLRKRALVVEDDGVVQDAISHGIGSVYCRSEYRGMGYAKRMIQELRNVLERWQQEPGECAKFNVLYSDIGKNFYAKEGWLPFASAHILLPPLAAKRTELVLPPTRELHADNLHDLCKTDEAMLRAGLARSGPQSGKTRVALLPDIEVMQWHHARENFLAWELLGKTPTVRGALVDMQDGRRVWAIWTRTFQQDQAENTLHILRIVIEDEECYMELHEEDEGDEPTLSATNSHSNGHSNGQSNGHSNGHSNGQTNGHRDSPESDDPPKLRRVRTTSETHGLRMTAVAACINAAQQEAARWNLPQVDIWNPSPTVLAAARICEASVELIHRDTSSIASLLWYGPKDPNDVEWVCNEKFGWC